jgi:hypothetical protein
MMSALSSWTAMSLSAYRPSALSRWTAGTVYVVDSGNNRVLKLPTQ